MERYRGKNSKYYEIKPYDTMPTKAPYNSLVFIWINFFFVNTLALTSFFVDWGGIVFVLTFLFFVPLLIPLAICTLALYELFKVKKPKKYKGIIIFISTYIICFFIVYFNLSMYLNFYLFENQRQEIAITATETIKIDETTDDRLYPNGLVVRYDSENNKLVYFRVKLETLIGISNADTPDILRQSGFIYMEKIFSNDEKLPINAHYIQRINDHWYYIKYNRVNRVYSSKYAKDDVILAEDY